MISEKLQIIDRMFSRIHCRSDLPGLFIEGGTASLNQLFGRPSEMVETVAANKNWYKKAQHSEAQQLEKHETKGRVIWEDSQGQIMWIKGDTANSPLTWREMKEAIKMKDQTSGAIIKEINGVRFEFVPSFRTR